MVKPVSPGAVAPWWSGLMLMESTVACGPACASMLVWTGATPSNPMQTGVLGLARALSTASARAAVA